VNAGEDRREAYTPGLGTMANVVWVVSVVLGGGGSGGGGGIGTSGASAVSFVVETKPFPCTDTGRWRYSQGV